jgi:hypothetical protein
MSKLRTTTQIIERLGGTAEVARFTRRPMAQVSRWKRWGKFPPQLYVCMSEALERQGHEAPLQLWGQFHYEQRKGRWVTTFVEEEAPA